MKKILLAAVASAFLVAPNSLGQGVCYDVSCGNGDGLAGLIEDTYDQMMLLQEQSYIYVQNQMFVNPEYEQCISNCASTYHDHKQACISVYGGTAELSDCLEAVTEGHSQCLKPYQVCNETIRPN